MTARAGGPARMSLVVVALLVTAGACSSPGGTIKPIGAGRPTSTAAIAPTTSPTASALAPTTTSVDATEAAILAAYRAAWVDIDAVQDHYPVHDSDPRLANHLAGDELTRVQGFSAELKLQGQYLTGPPTDTSAAIVRELKEAVGVVSDCNVDRSILMNGTTNQVVKPATSGPMLRNAKIELIGEDWKMTEFSNVGVTCTVAY